MQIRPHGNKAVREGCERLDLIMGVILTTLLDLILTVIVQGIFRVLYAASLNA